MEMPKMDTTDLNAVERDAFRATADDGLWDLLIASVVAMFAIAPLLSGSLGDFWSSAVFLPVYVAVYLAIRLVRERFVAPRVGVVEYGPERKERLTRFGAVLLALNVIAVTLGGIAFLMFDSSVVDPIVFPIVLSLIVLAGSSLAAWQLGIPRLFLYGVMLALGPLIGEWLWRQGSVSHHGFPLVFGIAAAVIAVSGLVRFARVTRERPAADDPRTAGNGV